MQPKCLVHIHLKMVGFCEILNLERVNVFASERSVTDVQLNELMMLLSKKYSILLAFCLLSIPHIRQRNLCLVGSYSNDIQILFITANIMFKLNEAMLGGTHLGTCRGL